MIGSYGRTDGASAFSPRAAETARRRGLLLGVSALSIALSVNLSEPAHAQQAGGAGGNPGGGTAGTTNAAGVGTAGGNATNAAGGGGGGGVNANGGAGGGGAAGGAAPGGAGANGAANQGGGGGAGAATSLTTGGSGTVVVNFAGNSGGAGGAGGAGTGSGGGGGAGGNLLNFTGGPGVDDGIAVGATATGGAGGAGGSATGTSGNGGAGGGGGSAFLFTGSGASGNVIGAAVGGAGGAGGNSGSLFGNGGAGGAGGTAISATGALTSLINAGSITGGAGGGGGTTVSGVGGTGGAGGAGVSAIAGGAIINSGTITGGAGGAGANGAGAGIGGAGLAGSGLTIGNSGSIAGGAGSSAGPALDLSKTNRLTTLGAGSLTGDIRANGGTLTLDQTVTGAGNAAYANKIVDTGGSLNVVVDAGAHAVTLSNAGNNQFQTQVKSGTLSVTNVGALGGGNLSLVIGGQTSPAFELAAGAGAQTLAQTVSINAGVAGTFGAGADSTLTIAPGAGKQLNLTGGAGTTLHFGSAVDTGTVVLAPTVASIDVNGAVSVDGGTLQLGSASGGGAAISLLKGGLNVGKDAATTATLDANGVDFTANNLTGSSKGVITSNGAGLATVTTRNTAATTYSGVIQDGAGKVGVNVQTSGGALTLAGANTYSGATTIDAAATLKAGAVNAFSQEERDQCRRNAGPQRLRADDRHSRSHQRPHSQWRADQRQWNFVHGRSGREHFRLHRAEGDDRHDQSRRREHLLRRHDGRRRRACG